MFHAASGRKQPNSPHANASMLVIAGPATMSGATGLNQRGTPPLSAL